LSTAVELVIDCGLDFAYRGRMDSPHNPNRDTAAAAHAAGADVARAGVPVAGVPVHPVLGFARAVEDALDRLADARLWSMTAAEQQDALMVLHRVETRVAELDLRVLAAAERNQVGAEAGATSTAAWLAQQTRQTRGRCAAAARLAAELGQDGFAATRQALAAGSITLDHARVITDAVNALTREYDDLPADTHLHAEAHLLDLAAEFDAHQLRRLGKRLFEVVCPEAADAAEGQRLAREEERARRTASLSMRDNGDGTVEGRFRIPVLHGDLLTKALEALTAPRRIGQARVDPRTGKKLPYPVLLGQGFTELLEHHLNPANLPSQGGSPFTVVVTIGIDALLSGLGTATLETGNRISAGEARRLLCRAGVIPAVLGGDSVVLDLGRERRLFNTYQRLALNLKYGGCAVDNCDRPASWTEAHHDTPWAHDGPTNLANGKPYCPPHHHMADHPETWKATTLPSGKVRFSRRQ
jgi:hypothetical protein